MDEMPEGVDARVYAAKVVDERIADYHAAWDKYINSWTYWLKHGRPSAREFCLKTINPGVAAHAYMIGAIAPPDRDEEIRLLVASLTT